MLKVEGISLTYETSGGARVPALEAVTLEVKRSEFVVLCGPSGCGKSSILRLVAGLIMPQRGRVSVEGTRVRGPSPERGIVFQTYNSFPWLSVGQNIEFSLRNLVRDREERKRIVGRQLEVMGLEGFEDSYPSSLSGGMRQRVALARTLAMNPVILLLDEPFGALDPMTRYSLQLHLQAKALENDWTILFVTHDVDEAILLGDRVLVLSQRPARVVGEKVIPFRRPREAVIRDRKLYREIRDGLLADMTSSGEGVAASSVGSWERQNPLKQSRTFSWSRVLRNSS